MHKEEKIGLLEIKNNVFKTESFVFSTLALHDSSSSFEFINERNRLEHTNKAREIENWASFWIIAWCCLIGDSGRGLMMPTLWSLVSSLGGNLVWQGIVVGSFSLGRIIASPILGYFSDVYGYRSVLIIANAVIAFGALFYSQSLNLTQLILSQFIIGLGAGTLGVTRSYVAENSTKENRTDKMAWLTAMQYLGFTVTPLAGAFFAYLGSTESVRQLWIFPGNNYGSAAYVLCFLAILEIIFLINYFQEQNRNIDLISEAATIYAVSPTSNPEARVVARRCPDDYLNLVHFGCFLNFCTKGTIAVYETMESQIEFSVLHGNATILGILVSTSGLIGVVILLFFRLITNKFSDHDIIIMGIGSMSILCFILGCSVQTGTISLWQFGTSVICMYSFAYPVGHTALLGMFSKIISDGPQGQFLGWFASAGSLARVLFPILAGVLSSFYDDNLIFLLMFFILLTSAFLTIWLKEDIKRMLNE